MTTPILWWRERLLDRFPLSEIYAVEGYAYKRREGDVSERWPARVARQDLYRDYVAWVNDNNAKAWPDKEPEDRRPLPASELVFFSTLTPVLYLGNKARMVKNYHIKEQVLFEGRYVTVKKRRYFIRLAAWQEHVDAYLRETASGSL